MKKIILISLIALYFGHGSLAQTKPLELGGNFDYDLFMPAHEVNGQKFHSARTAAETIHRLLSNGTPEDIENAEKIVPGLISCQIRDENSPHYGAFRWELETPVEDLNAVEFVLFALIPAMIEHEELLSKKTSDLLRESIRLGLINIRNIDVTLKYTNIAIKDITNTCLGGELLGDPTISNRGYRKLVSWMEFTDRSGGNYEYNSIPYTVVAIRVISTLNRYVKDEHTRVRSGIILSRMSLGAYLHAHTPTGRWAGPHGRAYHKPMIGLGGTRYMAARETETMEEWVRDGLVPSWLDGLISERTWPDQVIETTGRDEGILISSYKADKYSLGVASRNMFNQDIIYIAWQSNVFTLHYSRPESEFPGIVYTRYVLDDDWLGDFSPGPGRGNQGLIPDVGHFQGVQDQNRAIALYSPQNLGALDRHSSAKAVIAIPRWGMGTDRVWIDDKELISLPAVGKPTSTVVIESGEIMMAFKPFSLTNLGAGEQLRVQEKDGTLMIELYNYKGPEKTFWELAWPGTFYQGLPKCGFYSEVADRKDFRDGSVFAELVNSGHVTDVADKRSTFTGTESRKWKVAYERDGRTLGLEVDLFDWFKAVKRWNQNGTLDMPMLESRFARQSKSGHIEIGDVSLCTSGKNSAWLYVSPDGSKIVAAYNGPEPSALKLEGPTFNLELSALKGGMIIWENGVIDIDAIDLEGKPKLTGAKLSN
ncbi:MAG: hypothetical protein AB3N63_02375 [Puniceicoccaceae bacterium]